MSFHYNAYRPFSWPSKPRLFFWLPPRSYSPQPLSFHTRGVEGWEEKLEPFCSPHQHFSLHFLYLAPDKAKVSSCQVIVHCLAGISRSATIAIAYIMKTMGMSSDDAYR